MTRISTTKAREHFTRTLSRVQGRKQRVVLERRGKDVAAIVPIEDFEMLERFAEALEDREDIEAALEALKDPERIPYEQVRKALRPLHDENDLDAATEMLQSLTRESRLTAEEQDYLDVLSDIIERYEDEHHPIPDLPPREFLRESLASTGITQTELSRATGVSAAVISNILEIGRASCRERVCQYV